MVPGYRFWGWALSLYSVSCRSSTKNSCNTKVVFNHFDRDYRKPSSIIIIHIELTVLRYVVGVHTHPYHSVVYIPVTVHPHKNIPVTVHPHKIKTMSIHYSHYHLPIFPNESPNDVEQPFSFGLKYPVADGTPFEHQGADPKSDFAHQLGTARNLAMCA